MKKSNWVVAKIGKCAIICCLARTFPGALSAIGLLPTVQVIQIDFVFEYLRHTYFFLKPSRRQRQQFSHFRAYLFLVPGIIMFGLVIARSPELKIYVKCKFRSFKLSGLPIYICENEWVVRSFS